MGFFSNAKDNYEKRQQIADWNYRAREYISEGQRMYEEAYGDLAYACSKTESKMLDFVRYKQKILDEINRTLKQVDASDKELKISTSVDFINLETCAVTQNEQLNCIDKALATWVTPSVTDLFHNISSEEYYEAKQNMYQAKAYKEQMKAKRDELRLAKTAVKEIPSFISDEKSQIEQLMDKFRKTVDGISTVKASEKVERKNSLCKIAQLIADSMQTQLITSDYQITDQYKAIHSQIAYTNDSLSSALWLV